MGGPDVTEECRSRKLSPEQVAEARNLVYSGVPKTKVAAHLKCSRRVIYDALELEWRTLKVRKDPNCALCGENPTVTELIDYDAFCGAVSEEASDAAAGATISVNTLEQMLKERAEGSRDFTLVDVREPNEYEINKIPGSVLIPKGEFLNGNALEQLSQDTQVVLHCKSGVRSAEALAVLKGAGYSDAVHVGGGVVAWVDQIDSSQPTY